MKTILQFDLIKDDNDYFIDPDTLYVFGFINFIMLEDFLTSSNYLNYIDESLKEGSRKNITLEVWEETDDYRKWLDYKILPNDYKVELPENNTKNYCNCIGGPKGRTLTPDFEYQICEKCGKIKK